MTCEPYERDLALAIEGDLPMRERAPLERHLQQCARCQEFLQGLKESQRKVKGLATEPLDEAALAAVRRRVVAVLHQPRPSRVVPAWGWMLAAGLAAAALALAALVSRTTPTASRQTDATLLSPPAASGASGPTAVPVEAPAPPPAGGGSEHVMATPSRRPSTVRPARGVSQGVESETARVVPELGPDDAEQLARAVVAVSRIRRVTDRPPEPPVEPLPPAVVRLQTSDPGVVIYWQLDSNGG